MRSLTATQLIFHHDEDDDGKIAMSKQGKLQRQLQVYVTDSCSSVKKTQAHTPTTHRERTVAFILHPPVLVSTSIQAMRCQRNAGKREQVKWPSFGAMDVGVTTLAVASQPQSRSAYDEEGYCAWRGYPVTSNWESTWRCEYPVLETLPDGIEVDGMTRRWKLSARNL